MDLKLKKTVLTGLVGLSALSSMSAKADEGQTPTPSTQMKNKALSCEVSYPASLPVDENGYFDEEKALQNVKRLNLEAKKPFLQEIMNDVCENGFQKKHQDLLISLFVQDEKTAQSLRQIDFVTYYSKLYEETKKKDSPYYVVNENSEKMNFLNDVGFFWVCATAMCLLMCLFLSLKGFSHKKLLKTGVVGALFSGVSAFMTCMVLSDHEDEYNQKRMESLLMSPKTYVEAQRLLYKQIIQDEFSNRYLAGQKKTLPNVSTDRVKE